MGDIGAATGGFFQANAEEGASRRNARSARDANQTNLLLNLAGRGAALPARVGGLNIPSNVAGREAAILPYYFNDRERALAEASGAVFDATGRLTGTPTEQGARAQSIVDQFLPITAEGTNVVRGIYNDELTRQAAAESQPVYAARRAVAGARKDAGLTALQATLNEIRSIQARKGYTGDSLAEQRLGLDARTKIFGDAAVDLSSAELANATDTRAIQSAGRNLKLSSLALPTSQAQNVLNLTEQPADTVQTSFNRRLQPFQFFRTTATPFQVNPLPTVQPQGNPFAALLAGGGNAERNLASAYLRGAFRPATQPRMGSGAGYAEPYYGAGSGWQTGGAGAGAYATPAAPYDYNYGGGYVAPAYGGYGSGAADYGAAVAAAPYEVDLGY